ncbi:hypothetical protein Mal15_51770 [Stieleria maiorica]|uniref:Uncharacterized protein n=1 Tax=Stieleria maiorica TaxID=2795974 RepID=A0A5B9MM54_9BACT|nr:hypothetical protein Mal15_51770 [Stieleria maiorica]
MKPHSVKPEPVKPKPVQLDRRRFLARSGRQTLFGLGAFHCAAGLAPQHRAAADESVAAPGKRPKIAFLGTVVRRHSHAQHFLDRHTLGYSWNGRWQQPRIDVASVFIDQFPDDDLARGRVKRHGLKLFPTIEEALTLGGETLAVDGVVVIGEHGDYPRNEKGQYLYPRYDWFKRIVNVFERSGRSVPVFNDKHLSTDWNECVEMVDDARRLGFPFLAGSSLPVTRRMPAIEMPYDAPLQESVCVAYGGIDSYDIHALETAQCMSERRAGGERGVRRIHALRGDNLWKRLESEDCKITRQLVAAALSRSHNLPVETGFPTDVPSIDWMRQTMPQTTGYLIEHLDGLKTTMLLTGIRDFNYAGMLADGSRVSCQMYLPMPGHGSTTADFFNPLVRHIETMILDGKAPYPVQRTLLTSGMVIGGVDSLHAGEKPIDTPHLDIAYTAPKASTFWSE